MSTSRRNLIARISSVQWEVLRHLLKIIMHADIETKNHWKLEIFAMLLGCHVKLKQDNKYPTPQFYWENLYGNLDNEERLSWITGAVDSIFENPPEFDYSKVKNRISMIFQEISNLMATPDFNRTNLYKILDKEI